MTARIRIGAVSYLNTRPLVHGIEAGLGRERIELSYATPAALAEGMAGGELDVALLPVVELARMPQLAIVPGLGIVTRGPSRSVLLVSKRPVERVASVALDPESRTSNALARVLFAEVWRRQPEFRTAGVEPSGPRTRAASLEETLVDCDAAVRIGDKALFEPLPEGVECHDLGAVWSETTGLPFVFAVWAARPGAVDREVYRILHESRRRGTKAVRSIAADYEWRGQRYPDIALEYLTRHICFDLGDDETRAIDRFLRAVRDIGLIESVPEIRLVREGWPSRECEAAVPEVGAETDGGAS